MGRPNGLDVPEAVVALLAVLPFKVTVWVMRSPGEGDEFEVIKGPCGWGVRASSGYMDSLRGASYGKATLRHARQVGTGEGCHGAAAGVAVLLRALGELRQQDHDHAVLGGELRQPARAA
jgi:hypothetical protein